MEVFRLDKDRWMSRFKGSRTQLAELQAEIAEMVNFKRKKINKFRKY